MNAIEKLIAQNNLDPVLVMWKLRDSRLVSDNAIGPQDVCEADALKAAAWLLAATKRQGLVAPKQVELF